jgi:hypothetical protein
MDKLSILLVLLFFSCNQGEEVNPKEEGIHVDQLLGTWEVDKFYNGNNDTSQDAYYVYENIDFLAYRFSEVKSNEVVHPDYMYKYEGVVAFNYPEVDTVNSSAFIKIENNQILYYDSSGRVSPSLPSDDIYSVSDSVLMFHWHSAKGYTILKAISNERFDDYWIN